MSIRHLLTLPSIKEQSLGGENKMKRKLVLITCLSLLNSGCAFLNEEPVIPDNVFLLQKGPPKVPDSLPEVCTNTASRNVDFMTLPEIDRCTDAMKGLIDVRWAQYEDQLRGTINWGNAGMDIATLGVTAAGTLTGATTTHILSAIAAGLTGSKAAINSNVLYNNSILIVLTQMKADRASLGATIELRENEKSANHYRNMYQAANDLYAYDRAGSFSEALISLQATAGAQGADCTAEQTNAKRGIAAQPSTGSSKCGQKK